jgi:serine/threonine-protein kinase
MGVIYKALHLRLNRVVALKVVREWEHACPGDLIRFLAEAEILAGLQHPNIVQVYEVGQHGGNLYFTMEFLAGGNLAQRLSGAPLPAPQAAVLVEKVARGVQHAHQHNVVHRDLKPSNVVLTADGTPKLTDFGLAKRERVGLGLTQTGLLLGTPAYMAPEQAEGRNAEAGPRTDVYALGAILYECLTGQPPFQAEGLLQVLRDVQSGGAVPPSRLVANVPHDLETVCLKCLQKDPKDRYASAQDLADDLRRFQAGEPILARRAPAWERGRQWGKRHWKEVALLAGWSAALAMFTLNLFAYLGRP